MNHFTIEDSYLTFKISTYTSAVAPTYTTIFQI